VKMTTKEMNAAELAAGTAALKTSLAASFPAWELSMAPQGSIEAAVKTVVVAIDAVRDAAEPKPTT
jgi:hypothetical protein